LYTYDQIKALMVRLLSETLKKVFWLLYCNE